MNKDYLKLPIPDQPGSELDLLMARHMGAKTLESGGLLWLLEGNRAFAVPPYSTDHNAFFLKVVPFLREKKIRLEFQEQGEDYVIRCQHPRHGPLANERQEALPHGACRAAIISIRMVEEKNLQQLGPKS